MQTKIFAIVLVPVVLAGFLAGAARAADSTRLPDGFRGIRWGAAATSIPGLTPVDRDGDIIHYDRSGTSKTLGGIELRSITYSFYKGRFYHAAIAYEGKDTYAAIERSLEAKYGPPDTVRHKTEPSGQAYEVAVWDWPGQVFIGNRHDQGKPGGRIFYFYAPLTDASAKEQGIGPSAAPKAQARAGKGSAATYVVKRGDFMARIAKRHGITEAALAAANPGLSDKNLKAGATINLPTGGGKAASASPAASVPERSPARREKTPSGASSRYTVKKGDIFSKIAKEHGLRSKDIEAANPGVDPKTLRPGMVLRLPASRP